MGDLILVEVLQGFRSDLEFQRAFRHLAALEFRPMAGREIAIAAARNHRALRARRDRAQNHPHDYRDILYRRRP